MSHGHGTHALTLHQPWAWALIEGHKNVENRSWPPPRWLLEATAPLCVAIHASQTWDDDGAAFCRLRGLVVPGRAALPRGHVIGWAMFGTPLIRPTGEPIPERLRCRTVTAGLGGWFTGPWGWPVRAVFRARWPQPVRGYQGIWRLPRWIDEASLRLEGAPRVLEPPLPDPSGAIAAPGRFVG